MSKEIIRGRKSQRAKHIGQRVKFYRECKELPVKLFAERCGIAVSDMCDIEAGKFFKLDTVVILKMSEVLGISYADLFETDDEKYFSNIDSPAIIDFLVDKANNMRISFAYIGKTLDVPKTTYHNWYEKKRISSPFDMQNVLSLLKVDADALKSALRPVVIEEPTTENTAEETVEPESKQMMNEILKAIEMYRNVGTLVAQLDEIIEKAHQMKIALGGN